MTRLSKLKISCRREKQYTSPVTLGGGLIIFSNMYNNKHVCFFRETLQLIFFFFERRFVFFTIEGKKLNVSFSTSNSTEEEQEKTSTLHHIFCSNAQIFLDF